MNWKRLKTIKRLLNMKKNEFEFSKVVAAYYTKERIISKSSDISSSIHLLAMKLLPWLIKCQLKFIPAEMIIIFIIYNI